MKKLILIFHFSLFVFHFSFAQQNIWTDLYCNMPDTPTDTIYINGDPYYNSFTDLFFINDNEGWVTSLQQNEEQEFLIFHTQDGGQNWDIQTSWWDYSHAIWMLDPENGYLGDHNGFIFVTHNGGETWDYHGATGGAVTDISFAPASDTGYVSLDNSYYLWQITPEGVTQIDIGGINFWSGISATDEKVWFCGGTHVFYYDLVTQELVYQLVQHCFYFGPVYFINENHGWIGNDCYIKGFADYDMDWPEIFNSDENAVTCIFALDTNQVWATLMDGRIILTHNGSDYGVNPETHLPWSNVVWETQPHPYPENTLNAIQFTSPDNGYACGENNTLLKYTQISGTDELTEPEFKVFPNPTQGKFQITSNQHQTNNKSKINPKFQNEINRVEIVDLFGHVVKTSDLDMEIDISDVPVGVYFCKICFSDLIIVKKIVKF